MTYPELKEKLEEKLTEINSIIDEKHESVNDIGVLAGLSGLSLFKFYYAGYTGDRTHEEAGEEMLSEGFDKINNNYIRHTFCSGIAGAGWVLEHLKEEDFVEIDSDELLSVMDDYLFQMMNLNAEEFYYDFLHGALGIAYYFLKRYESTESEELRDRYADYLKQVLDKLEDTAIIQGSTARWLSVVDHDSGMKGYNLSLSHGMSSIVNLLSRIAEKEQFRTQTLELLRKAVNYIISNETGDSVDGVICNFPDVIYEKGDTRQSGRLAWCYGDLGTAISLWHAGKSLNDEDLTRKSIRILRDTTKLKLPADTKITDVGICHGAAGLMHIYMFLYRSTAIHDFKEAADYWALQTLDMAIHPEGYAGYSQRHPRAETGWEPTLNVLEGIAGIGLSIMSYLAPGYDNWNKSLMIG